MTYHDPYKGNILIEKLGEIKSRKEISKFLTYLPKLPPENIGLFPRHIRLHMLQDVRDLHITSLNEARIAESIDLMLRQSYKYRDPKLASTWRNLYSNNDNANCLIAPPMALGVLGLPGVGKTQSVKRSLSCYRQIINHAKFPNIINSFNQVSYISVDVPSSRKTEDLAVNLMNAWDQAMSYYVEGYIPRFTESLNKTKYDGNRMLEEWRQVATTQYLGLLHLDEAQNFFSIPSLKKRNTDKSRGEPLKLSIKEDACLKWVLSLTNTWKIPIAFSCTPDGMNALTSRFSNLQRFSSYGLHQLKRFERTDDPDLKIFLSSLFKYQYVKNPLTETSQIAEVIIQLSAGIQRVIIALWVAAHRIAFEREDDDSLRVNDFIHAAKIHLSAIAPAIKALNSGVPSEMYIYEDMLGNEEFWDSFWNSILSMD